MQIIQIIQNRIYEIRGERVMLDRDLASLYEIETRLLNQAVRRNIRRFPKDFMFKLTREEFEDLRLQFETSNNSPLRSQIVISKGKGGTRYLPYAFTEHGVAMLSGVLNSDKAITMPARMNPFGREHCDNAGFCGRSAGTAEVKRYQGAAKGN